MALFAGSLYAESLGMNTGVTVSLPGERRDRTGDMPVLYLLHGLSDDHTCLLYTSLHGFETAR